MADDIFDQLAAQQTPTNVPSVVTPPASGDIFDRLAAKQPKGDVFDRMAAQTPQGATSNSIVAAARAYKSTPYKFGGQDVCTGADCSGFTQNLMGKLGVSVPRTAAEQYTQGQRVDLKNLQPGDLVFKANTYKPGISHVGVVLPGGKVANMASTKTGYQEDDIAKWLADKKTVGARRYLNPVAAGMSAGGQIGTPPTAEPSTVGQAVGQLAGSAAAQDVQPTPQPGTINFADPKAQKAYLDYRTKYLQPGDQSAPAQLADSIAKYPNGRDAQQKQLSQMSPIGQAAILDRVKELQDEANGIPSMRAPLTNQNPPGLLQRIADAPGSVFNAAGAPVKLGAYEMQKGVESLVGGASKLPGDVAEAQRLAGMNPYQRMMALKEQPFRALGQPESEMYNQRRDTTESGAGRLLNKGGAMALDVGLNPITAAAGALGTIADVPGASALVRGANVATHAAFTANMAAGLAKTNDPVDWLIGLPLTVLGALGTVKGARALKARGVSPETVAQVAQMKQAGAAPEEIKTTVQSPVNPEHIDAARKMLASGNVDVNDLATENGISRGEAYRALTEASRTPAETPAPNLPEQPTPETNPVQKPTVRVVRQTPEGKPVVRVVTPKVVPVPEVAPENVARATMGEPSPVTETPANLDALAGRVQETPVSVPAEQPGQEARANQVRPAEPVEVPADTLEGSKVSDPNLTGAKNATTTAERLKRGMTPVEKQAFTKVEEAFNQGVEANTADPAHTRKVAEEVASNPRPLTAKEVGALTHDRAQLEPAYEEALKKVNAAIDASADTETIAGLQETYRNLRDAVDLNDQALQKGGREQSAAFAARRMMARKDTYTFAGIEARERAAKGRPLTQEEATQLKALAETNKKLQAMVDAQEAKIAAHVASRGEEVSKAVAAEVTRRMAVQEKLQTDRSVRRATKADLSAEWNELWNSLKPKDKTGGGRLNMSLPLGERYEHIDVIPTLKKMAANLIKRGMANAEEIAQTVHTAAVEHLPDLTVREVRDAISGYGRTVTRTASEAAKQLRDLQKQMRLISAIEDATAGETPASGNAPGKPSQRVVELRRQLDAALQDSGQKTRRVPTTEGRQAAKQKRLETQIDALDRQIKTGEVPTKAGAVPDTELIKRLTAERDNLKKQLPQGERPAQTEDQRLSATKKRVQKQLNDLHEQLKAGNYLPEKARLPVTEDTQLKAMRSELDARRQKVAAVRQAIDRRVAKSEPKGALDYLTAAQREAVLSGVSVFEKLGGASGWAIPVETLADFFGAAAGELRVGGKSLKSLAGREGGYSPGAAVERVRGTLSREALRNAVQNVKTGMDAIDTIAGEQAHANELGGYVGRTHGAVKAFLKTGEYRSALMKRLQKLHASGSDINDPQVRLQAGMQAAMDAQQLILKNDNALSSALNGAIGRYQKSPSVGVRALGAFFRTLVPVTRVASNYVGRTADMTGAGILRGAVRHGIEAAKTARTGEAMPPEVADQILRAYKYGGVGLVAAYIGLTQPDWFKSAGFFTPGEKPKRGEPTPMQAGSLQIAGHNVPALLAHSPFANAVQFWATMGNGFRKHDAQTGIYDAMSGLSREVPGVESTVRMAKAYEGLPSMGKVAGEYTKSFVPQLAQQATAYSDKDVTGEPINRNPGGYVESVKTAFPITRQQVPMRNIIQASPDAKVITEMRRLNFTPAQVSDSIEAYKGQNVKLSAKDATAYRATVQKAVLSNLHDLMHSSAYDTADDATKIALIKKYIQMSKAVPRAEQKANVRGQLQRSR